MKFFRKYFRHQLFMVLLLFVVSIAFGSESIEDHRGMKIAHWLEDKGIPRELVIVIIAMLPIVELRGAIPVAHIMGMNPFLAYVLAVLGNMLPVLPLLLLLGPISRLLMRNKLGNRFFTWLFVRTRKRIGGNIEKYETMGLSVFVAIPLPVTGAWTGCAGAFLFGIKTHHAFWAIFLGVLSAGVIVSILSILGWIGALIAGIVLIALIVNALLIMFKREKKKDK